jgi:protein SCO1/2
MGRYPVAFAILLALAIGSRCLFAQAVLDSSQDLKGMNVVEHLGDTIPLNYKFINTAGDTVTLGEYFHHGIPVVLAMYYSNCPMLCSLVLMGLSQSAGQMNLVPGRDYQMLSISIDPKETFETAAASKKRYLAGVPNAASSDAWEFLISPENNSKIIADSLGFEYFYVKDKNQYAHPAVIFVLSESGKISRYLYGIKYDPRDLRLALLEASQGKVGNTVDRIILYCYHYDPDAKGYVVVAGNVMRVGGAITLAAMLVFVGGLWLWERHRHTAKTSN